MNRQLWLVSLAFFLAMFGYNIGQNFLSLQASPFLSVWEISVVVAMVYAAFAVSSLFSGKLIERYGTIASIRLGALLYVPFLLFLWSSKSFLLLLLGALLVGLGAGFLWVAGPTFVLHNTEKRGRHMGIFRSIVEFGAALAGLVGGVAASFLPLETVFLFGGVLLTLSVLPTFFMSDRKVERKTYAWSEQLGMLADRNLLVLSSILFASSLMFGAIIPLLPLVVKSLGGGAFEVGVAFFIYSAFMIVWMIGGGIKSDEIGRKKLLAASLVVGAVASLLLFATDNYILVLAAVAGSSLVRGLSTVLVDASIGDIFREKIALANSVKSFYSVFGVVLGSLVSGALGGTELRLPFLVIAGVMLLSVVLVKWVDVK